MNKKKKRTVYANCLVLLVVTCQGRNTNNFPDT